MAQSVQRILLDRKRKLDCVIDDLNVKEPKKDEHKNPSFTNDRLSSHFYQQECLNLAKALLGKILIKKVNDEIILKGRIVETEGYLGFEDKASHSYNGKRTKRTEAMYMKPGTSYVYSIYGMYHCLNISSLGNGAAVLIRALEPMENLDIMRTYRKNHKNSSTKLIKEKDLCNGPSKLTLSFDINKENANKLDLTDPASDLYITDDLISKEYDIVSCTRIGLNKVDKEWREKPFRFYINDNIYVSKLASKMERKQVSSIK